MSQVGTLGSVQAALTNQRLARLRRAASACVLTVDDLWDWERWGPPAIARRVMDPDEIEAFGSAIEGAVRQYIDESETRDE